MWGGSRAQTKFPFGQKAVMRVGGTVKSLETIPGPACLENMHTLEMKKSDSVEN